MKKLRTSRAMTVAGLSVFGGATIAFLILFPINQAAAQIVGFAILATLIPVYKYLRETQIKELVSHDGEVITFGIRGFALKWYLKWYLMILYGSTFFFLGYQLSAMLFGMMAGATLTALRLSPQALSVTLNNSDYHALYDIMLRIGTFLAAFVVRPVFAFLVGKWVGKKGNKYGIASIFAITILVAVADVLLLVVVPESLLTHNSNLTKDLILTGSIRMEIIILIVSIPFGLLGYWRGRKKMLNGYLQDLFKHVPRDKRAAVVESLYREIVAINAPKAAPVETADDAPASGV